MDRTTPDPPTAMGLARRVRALDRADYLELLRAARFVGAMARRDLRWKMRGAIRAARARVADDVADALLDRADASRAIVVVALAFRDAFDPRGGLASVLREFGSAADVARKRAEFALLLRELDATHIPDWQRGEPPLALDTHAPGAPLRFAPP